MTIVTRASAKSYFDTGDQVSAQAMIDLIDSHVNRADTTAQSLTSDLSLPEVIANVVSAAQGSFDGHLIASAASFTGRLRQGVSAATSAADSRGDIVVVQESTVAGAVTAQVAFLPSTSNITRLGIKLIVPGSVAAGGVRVNVGTSDARNYFGTISVSARGQYDFTDVSAVRLTGVSGRIEMVASGASAGTNIVGFVQYYQRA